MSNFEEDSLEELEEEGKEKDGVQWMRLMLEREHARAHAGLAGLREWRTVFTVGF